MPELANPQHEAYAQMRARGFDMRPSYRAAGFDSSQEPKAIDASCRRLKKFPEIDARILELKETTRVAAIDEEELNKGYVLSNIKHILEKALEGEEEPCRHCGKMTGSGTKNLAAANTAAKNIGIELGMFDTVFRVEHLDDRIESMSDEDLRAMVMGLVTQVGLRVVSMDDEENREYIKRVGPKVGLRIESGDLQTGGHETPPIEIVPTSTQTA